MAGYKRRDCVTHNAAFPHYHLSSGGKHARVVPVKSLLERRSLVSGSNSASTCCLNTFTKQKRTKAGVREEEKEKERDGEMCPDHMERGGNFFNINISILNDFINMQTHLPSSSRWWVAPAGASQWLSWETADTLLRSASVSLFLPHSFFFPLSLFLCDRKKDRLRTAAPVYLWTLSTGASDCRGTPLGIQAKSRLVSVIPRIAGAEVARKDERWGSQNNL